MLLQTIKTQKTTKNPTLDFFEVFLYSTLSEIF